MMYLCIIFSFQYEESKARNIAYKPTAWYYHHFDFIPTPKKMPRYNDHLGFVVIPIAAPNQPDANEASSKPRAVNNIGEQPELKQLPQYETAQITTTNGLVETDTTAQLDLEASTNEPDLMASPNEPDLMASTNEPDLMASTNEPDLMASPNEPDLMASTNEPDLMASTNEPDLMASTNEPDLIAEEPNSYQNLSVSDYLLVIERDQTTMQFVAYELDKNAVAHLKLAYSDN
ncbi:histone-lysine N-methyltransferase 2D [Spodoptera frugiperda]|uniref:Histone-lysine N-methyltransferase 2D n=1 Tax=Spodoptera frugiperda TaxID=7108 RepID=A0A9R0DCF9_SPOFR|nr:histone-lysine N-methyltransferase 2D [Spodoptera frugiperda]